MNFLAFMLFILCQRSKLSKKWHLFVFCLNSWDDLRFHEIFLFEIGIYYGNVTENGTAGMMVMTMTAVDYDDAEEGTNAKLKYSIEKNVIDEHTGTPIFEIEEETGVIKTAVCCLDREKTPDYSIQGM